MRLLKKTSRKPLIITLSVALGLALAVALWYYALADRNEDSASTDTSTTTQGEIADSVDKEADSTKASEDDTDEPKEQSVEHEKEKKLPQLYEGGNSSTAPDLTGAITSKSIQGSNLVIRNTINQLISSGVCELTLTSASKTVTKSAEIIQNPSSSACAGFDVPVSELGSGQWDLKIKVTSEDKELILNDKVNI